MNQPRGGDWLISKKIIANKWIDLNLQRGCDWLRSPKNHFRPLNWWTPACRILQRKTTTATMANGSVDAPGQQRIQRIRDSLGTMKKTKIPHHAKLVWINPADDCEVDLTGASKLAHKRLLPNWFWRQCDKYWIAKTQHAPKRPARRCNHPSRLNGQHRQQNLNLKFGMIQNDLLIIEWSLDSAKLNYKI